MVSAVRMSVVGGAMGGGPGKAVKGKGEGGTGERCARV